MGGTNNHCMAKRTRHSNQSGAEPRTPNSSRVMEKISDMPGLIVVREQEGKLFDEQFYLRTIPVKQAFLLNHFR